MGRAPKTSGCFFSGLTGAELSELARAAGAPVSGAKPDLVARLRAHPVCSAYADEGRSGTLSRATLEWVGARPGYQLPELKQLCKDAGLRSTGTKYELVLSLVRRAGPGGARVEDAAKPRAPSTKPASPDAIRARLMAKAEANRDAWSNQKCKDHAGTVFSAAHKILAAEAEDKGLLAAKNPALALAALAVLGAIRDGWSSLCSPGYGDSSYDLQCVFDLAKRVGEALGASAGADTRAQLRDASAAVRAEAARYATQLEDIAPAFA